MGIQTKLCLEFRNICYGTIDITQPADADYFLIGSIVYLTDCGYPLLGF